MTSLENIQEQTLTQANSILDEEGMTLEQKLEAINQAMASNAESYNRNNPNAAPIDPMDALHCEGCQ